MTDFTIDNLPFVSDSRTPSGGIGTFGELSRLEGGIAAFYGQSFAAPSTGPLEATSLSFRLETYPRDVQEGPLKYRVLLAPGPSPADALFTSALQTLPAHSPWTEVTVDLGATPLTGGQAYWWILDGYSDRNGLTGDAQVGTHNDYAGGAFYYGGYFSTAGAPLSSISLNEFGENIDLAFRMTFTAALDPPAPLSSAVPEPATWALMLLGFAAIAVANKQRRLAWRIEWKSSRCVNSSATVRMSTYVGLRMPRTRCAPSGTTPTTWPAAWVGSRESSWWTVATAQISNGSRGRVSCTRQTSTLPKSKGVSHGLTHQFA